MHFEFGNMFWNCTRNFYANRGKFKEEQTFDLFSITFGYVSGLQCSHANLVEQNTSMDLLGYIKHARFSLGIADTDLEINERKVEEPPVFSKFGTIFG